MTQPARQAFGKSGGRNPQDLPTTPFDRHVYGVAAMMRDKIGKLAFREGSFGEFRQDAARWAGETGAHDLKVFSVTLDVLQAIAVNPQLRQGINLGQYIPFGNYFTDETRQDALAHHETIAQAMIRTPDGPVFGKR